MENNQGGNKEHDFTIQTWKENFCFVVEGKRFYVARIILALISPVFEKIFQSDFKEKDQNEMELPGKLSANVEEFLKCIYPGVMKEVTVENAFQIIALAEEYQVDTLKEKCEECFLSAVNETSSIETLFKISNVACLYSLRTLSEKCSKFAAEKPLAELDEAYREGSIPPSTMCTIQRNIIEKMKAKELETYFTIDRLHREQRKTLALYKYHRAGVEKSDILDFDLFEGCDGATVYKKIVLQKLNSTKVCCSITLCETQLQLEFEIIFDSLSVTVSANEADLMQSHIKIIGNIVVFNGMAGKKNFYKKVKMMLNTSFNSRDVDLLKEVGLREQGYSYDGEVSVECNVIAMKEKAKDLV